MAYAMVRLVPVFLCMALVVVHVDSARLLLQAGKDPAVMTAEASAFSDDFDAEGATALVSTKDDTVYKDGFITPEFTASKFDLSKRDSTDAVADEGIFVGDTEETVGSGIYDSRSDATKRDAAYPAPLNEGASKFTFAKANQQFGSDELGSLGTAEDPQLFEFEGNQDDMP